MVDRRGLAVQELRSPADRRAEDDAKGLVTQAYPEHGLATVGAG